MLFFNIIVAFALAFQCWNVITYKEEGNIIFTLTILFSIF